MDKEIKVTSTLHKLLRSQEEVPLMVLIKVTPSVLLQLPLYQVNQPKACVTTIAKVITAKIPTNLKVTQVEGEV
jgi:hypothetical protein